MVKSDPVFKQHVSKVVKGASHTFYLKYAQSESFIQERFVGFLKVEEFTGESLSTLILNRLEELSISFEDCRGQSCDDVTYM